MMMFAWAPANNDPPELFIRWTWVKELGYPWEKAGIADEDVGHLARLVSIKNEADERKANSRAKGHAKGGRPGVG